MTPEEVIEIIKKNIVAQEAIIEFNDIFDPECDSTDLLKQNEAFNMAIEFIKEVQKYSKIRTIEGHWIPAEKELPPEPPEYVDDEGDLEEYIVMIDGAERPTTLRYAGDGNWWEDGTYYPVIAWQPLPNPYRPADKTEKPDWREGMLRKFDKRE